MDRKTTSKNSHPSLTPTSQKLTEDYSTESNSYTHYHDPLDINRFLNLEDPIEPKIEESYPSKLEECDYFGSF